MMRNTYSTGAQDRHFKKKKKLLEASNLTISFLSDNYLSFFPSPTKLDQGRIQGGGLLGFFEKKSEPPPLNFSFHTKKNSKPHLKKFLASPQNSIKLSGMSATCIPSSRMRKRNMFSHKSSQ